MNSQSHDYQKDWCLSGAGSSAVVQPFPAAASQVILICLMVLGVREDNKLYGSGMWRDEWLGAPLGHKQIDGFMCFKNIACCFS